MAPRLAGVLHGIGDACYSAGGFVVPLMINAMITDDPYLIRLRVLWTRLNNLVMFLTGILNGRTILIKFLECCVVRLRWLFRKGFTSNFVFYRVEKVFQGEILYKLLVY